MANCGPPYSRGTGCCKCCPPETCQGRVVYSYSATKSNCSSSSSSGGIETQCCPGTSFPTTLIATISDITGDCGCWGSYGTGGVFPLVYNGIMWRHEEDNPCGTGFLAAVTFTCNVENIPCEGLSVASTAFNTTMRDTCSCDPLLAIADCTTIGISGCTGTFVITVTE